MALIFFFLNYIMETNKKNVLPSLLPSFLRKKKTNSSKASLDVQMKTIDPRVLFRELKEEYNARDRYASGNADPKYLATGMTNTATKINELEKKVKDKYGDEKLEEIRADYIKSVCEHGPATQTNYGVIDCTGQSGGKRKHKKKKKQTKKRNKKGGMKKHQRRTRKTHKKVYPKITNNQNIGLRHKNGKRYAVLLGATNQPIVNRTTNKVNLYDYKTAINKHRLKKLSSYSPQFNPQGGEVKRNRKKTKKRRKRKH